MALTADVLHEMMFPNVGYMQEFYTDHADVYYKGALVNVDGDGKLKVAADVANESFVGIVAEQKTITTNGYVKVILNTVALIPHTGAALTDVGALFHASADDTLGDGAGSNVGAAGKCIGYESGYVLIDFSIKAL